jgi:hypothetical protein
MAEKTSTGKLIAAGGGIILIVSLFLSWYGLSVGGGAGSFANSVANNLHIDTTANGWQSLDVGDLFFFVVGLIAITPAALDVFDLELELPFDAGLVILVGGVISVLWIILRILDKPGGSTGGVVSVGLKFGIFVGLIGAALVAFGGFSQRGEAEELEYAPTAGVPPAAAPPGVPPAQPVAPPPPAAAPPAAPPPVAPPQAAPPQAAPPQAAPPQAAPPAAAPPAAAPPAAAPPAAAPPAAPPQQPQPPADPGAYQPPAGFDNPVPPDN